MNRELKEGFVDRINEYSTKHRLLASKYGYYYISPMPSKNELAKYYATKYLKDPLEVSSKGIDVGDDDVLERFHYERQYREIISFINEYFESDEIKILDVGCGTGKLLSYLKESGLCNLYGTEFDVSLSIPDISIFHGDFMDYQPTEQFDFIIMNNVLEHVTDPEHFLEKAYSLLNNRGYLRVQVPNDLSYAQFRVLKRKSKPSYYFILPNEHLNYFDFESLQRMLRAKGFKVVKKMTTWPMEMFIAMGIDYTDNPSIGNKCHKYRLNFEYRMGEKFLLEFYERMADLEFGRVVIEYSKKYSHINNILNSGTNRNE